MDLTDITDEQLQKDLKQALKGLEAKYNCQFIFTGDTRAAKPTKRKLGIDMIVKSTKEQEIAQYKKSFLDYARLELQLFGRYIGPCILKQEAEQNINNLTKYFNEIYMLNDKLVNIFGGKAGDIVKFVGYKMQGKTNKFVFQKIKTGKLLIGRVDDFEQISDILNNNKINNSSN